MKINIFTDLVRLRLSQILINEEYKLGKFKLPIHLSLGHEAIALAVSNTMKNEDKLLLTHRNISYNLAKCTNLRLILDEFLLNENGLCNGKLGSMNLSNIDENILYTSSILANNFSVAAGVAMANKIKNNQSVTYVLGGDGSMEEGSFYESLVMMKSLGLSVLVIIENNEWSLGTHISERRSQIDIEKLSNSLGIDYIRLEKNNVNNYLNILKKAREFSINNNEPICIEVCLKTLGDRRNPPSVEHPNGKYINYHAGPSTVVNITENFHGALLQYNYDDPIFVALEEIGENSLQKIATEIFSKLQSQLK